MSIEIYIYVFFNYELCLKKIASCIKEVERIYLASLHRLQILTKSIAVKSLLTALRKKGDHLLFR